MLRCVGFFLLLAYIADVQATVFVQPRPVMAYADASCVLYGEVSHADGIPEYIQVSKLFKGCCESLVGSSVSIDAGFFGYDRLRYESPFVGVVLGACDEADSRVAVASLMSIWPHGVPRGHLTSDYGLTDLLSDVERIPSFSKDELVAYLFDEGAASFWSRFDALDYSYVLSGRKLVSGEEFSSLGLALMAELIIRNEALSMDDWWSRLSHSASGFGCLALYDNEQARSNCIGNHSRRPRQSGKQRSYGFVAAVERSWNRDSRVFRAIVESEHPGTRARWTHVLELLLRGCDNSDDLRRLASLDISEAESLRQLSDAECVFQGRVIGPILDAD